MLGIGAEGASEEVAWWKRDLGELDEAEESASAAAMPMTLARTMSFFRSMIKTPPNSQQSYCIILSVKIQLKFLFLHSWENYATIHYNSV